MQFISIDWQSERYQQEIDLRDKVLRKPLGLTFSVADLDAERSQGRFGIVDNGELIACVLTMSLTRTITKFRQMAVAPGRQGQGVGRRLIENLEAVLAQRGTQRIELHARKVAIGFYEKLGYRCEGDEFTEVSIPHFKMVKELQASDSILSGLGTGLF